MPSPAADVPRSAKGRRRRPPANGPTPWWGAGEAPHLRWSGVTIDIAATWCAKRSRWESPDGQFYFDQDAAEFAEGFFPAFLEHHIGEFDGLPFELMAYQQLLVVRPLFGWKRAVDGHRRFRKVFLAVPKGSGKSPFGAGLGLFLAFFDGEPGAEVYAVAADRKQAGIVFDSAKVMTTRNEHLDARCEVFRDSIKLRGSTECFQVLSSDAGTKHGFRPHGIIFDEFHAQPDRDLFDTLYRGMGKRRQPVLVMITTAGDDDESICFEEWDYARRVIKGDVADPFYLPVVFEARPDEDWSAEATLRRVNPGYGITMKSEYFEAEVAAAKAEPRKQNSFKQLHANLWVNQAVAWLPIEWWDACVDPMPADAELAQLPCAAGLDLAQKYDLACFAVSFRLPLADPKTAELLGVEVLAETETGALVKREIQLNYRLVTVPFFWIPEDTMREREKDDGIPYSQWVADGLVTATPGTIIDYTRIFTDIRDKILPRFPRLKQGLMGYDPAFATDLATKLRDLLGLQVQEVLQNYSHLSEPSQIYEALVKAHRVVHGGHRTLRNHIGNVAVKTDDAGRIRPVKPKKFAGRKRIDGVVAGIMGAKMLAAVPDRPVGTMIFVAGRRS